MIIIAGRVFVDIKIDNKDLPSSANLVERITMTEGNGAYSPAIELILNDHSGHLGADLALTDGNEILVTIGRSANSLNTVSRQYRLFGQKQVVTAFGPQIKAVGTYDAPGYLSGSARESFKGNSSQALQEVATKSKMSYSGPEEFNGRSMNDSQVWRAVCQSRASYAQDVCRHGYMDPHSAMMLVATSAGCLKYRNLADVIEIAPEKIKRLFLHSVPPATGDTSKVVYQVRAAKDMSVSGLMNNWQNYGSTRYEHTLDGVAKSHDNIDVKTAGSYLSINSQVAQTVEKSRREYSPLDCGNTHTDYSRALYQNIKLLGLFSERLSLLTTDVTDVQLLDPVIYRQANADLKEPVKNSDVYLIVGKSILLKGGASYAERIELARMSLTTEGSSTLKCADPAADTASVIPAVSIDPTSTTANTSLPSVKALTTALAPATSSVKVLKSIGPSINTAVTGTLHSLSATLTAIKAGTDPQTLLGKIKSMLPSMGALNTVVNDVQSVVRVAAGSMNTIKNVLLTASVVAPGLRAVAMSVPGGPLDSLSASLTGIKQLTDHSLLMNSLNSALNPYKSSLYALGSGPATMDSFSSISNNIGSSVNSVTKDTASMWNSSLSIVSGKTPPSIIPVANSAYLKNQVDYSLSPNSGTPSSTTYITAADLSAGLQKGLVARTASAGLRWVPEAALGLKVPLTIDDAIKKVEAVQAESSLVNKQIQSQPSSWN